MNSDSRVENNIFQHVTVGMMTGGSTTRDGLRSTTTRSTTIYNVASWMQSSSQLHDGGIAFVLFEGNEGIGFHGRRHSWHGGTSARCSATCFTGWEPGKSLQTVPRAHLCLQPLHERRRATCWEEAGYHNHYESAAPSGTSGNTSGSHTLGWSGNAAGHDRKVGWRTTCA